MKKPLFTLLLLCLPILGMAQAEIPDTTRPAESKDTSKTSKVRKLDKLSEFPGGKEAMNKYLQKKLFYLSCNNESGKIVIRFVVSETGKIQDVVVIKSLNGICDKAAVRVVKSMPDWIPGQINGKNVSVFHALPITFKPLKPY